MGNTNMDWTSAVSGITNQRKHGLVGLPDFSYSCLKHGSLFSKNAACPSLKSFKLNVE